MCLRFIVLTEIELVVQPVVYDPRTEYISYLFGVEASFVMSYFGTSGFPCFGFLPVIRVFKPESVLHYLHYTGKFNICSLRLIFGATNFQPLDGQHCGAAILATLDNAAADPGLSVGGGKKYEI